MKGVAWKDLNTKFKNNFDKALENVLSSLPEEDRDKLNAYTAQVDKDLKKLKLKMLGERVKPPSGY